MTTVELLLRGAVRKDMGKGYRFYGALEQASVDELKRALTLLSGRHARGMYTYYQARLEAIRRQLEEVEGAKS